MIKIKYLLQRNLKIRLTAWYILLLGATLVLFSICIYWQLGQILLKQIDINLKVTASEILNSPVVDKNLLHPENNTHNLIKAGIAVRLITNEGKICYEIGLYPNLPQFLPKKTGYTNLSYQNNTWRVYSQILYYHHQQKWLQVAQSLQYISKAKEHLVVIMLLGLPIILVSASLGGFFLAHHSLLPIEKIIRAAESIRYDEIDRRINYSGSLDEVGRLAITLDRMFERLQTAFEQERFFTANASHELRTPLTVIKGRIGVALSRERTIQDYQNTLIDLEKEVNRLIRLTDGLLLLTRLEQTDLKAYPVELNNLLEILVNSFQLLAEEKTITLISFISSDLVILGDSDYLTSLFINLLDNAIKYTPEKGKVTVKAWKKDNQVYISITNSGQGITPEALPHLFQRFYRVENDRSQHRGGAGLGLAIAEEIVRLHQGVITVDSQLHQFTRFTVSFPALGS